MEENGACTQRGVDVEGAGGGAGVPPVDEAPVNRHRVVRGVLQYYTDKNIYMHLDNY